jgi:hypothetical protein
MESYKADLLTKLGTISDETMVEKVKLAKEKIETMTCDKETINENIINLHELKKVL